MNRQAMHIEFRQYAQQMGMQNIRTILPEQIDMLLNDSIVDVLNQLIREHINGTTEKDGADNTKLSQINSFRNLYVVRIEEFDVGFGNKFDRLYPNIKRYERSFNLDNVFYVIDFAISYNIPNYTESIWCPVRLVDEQYIAETLQDSFLKPTFKSPVATSFSTGNVFKIDLYLANSNFNPEQIKYSFIKTPNKLSKDEDVSDLPEHLHPTIVRHAVELYKVSIGQGSTTQQPQSQPVQSA